MLSQFHQDLEAAKGAEQLLLKLLQSKNPRYVFTDCSEDCSCYYKGDIRAVSKDFGIELYIEVKDDSRIADTKRVLCEDEVYYKNSGYTQKGNMHSNTDYYCVVSQRERIIYIFDFRKLKEIYKKGEFKVIPHAEQDTHCYLVDLWLAKRYGALIYKLKY